MSATGAWVVGVIPDAEARELLDRHAHLSRPGDRDKPAAFGRALAWWSNGGEDETFFERSTGPSGPLVPTSVAHRFADLIEVANPSTAATDAVQDESMALMPEAIGAALFVATARKANPVAALYYGLGARRSALLPGWFGDFLLSADEVRASLPRVEEALLLSDAQRSTALSRITAWMNAMGDAPDCVAAELIDAPLRVVRHAAEAGCGVAAFSRWY
ncbi:hypothetical protein ACFYXS_35230 [Streptomyces sp. NPDC002574]|uniref:hypothetical protein n=1 Tax=Streptomyces sp. NPDC002574 TaxID=3364652 RepID=UPI0036A5B999